MKMDFNTQHTGLCQMWKGIQGLSSAKTPATPSQPLNTHQAVWPPHGLQLALLPSSALGRLRVGGQSRLSLCGNLCCLRQHGWRDGVAGCKGEGESASG